MAIGGFNGTYFKYANCFKPLYSQRMSGSGAPRAAPVMWSRPLVDSIPRIGALNVLQLRLDATSSTTGSTTDSLRTPSNGKGLQSS